MIDLCRMQRRLQNAQLMGALMYLMGGPALAEGAPAVTVVDFEDATVGALPRGFQAALTGDGDPGAWAIQEDATFPDAGKVALWTKADSVTAFDALEVEAIVGERREGS